MEALALLGLAVAGWVLIAPLVALLRASSSRQRISRLEMTVAQLEATVSMLRRSSADPRAVDLPVVIEAPRDVAVPVPTLPAAPPPAPAEAPRPVTPAPAPPPPAPPVPPASVAAIPGPAAPAAATLEETIALVWFTRVGALALLLGAAYFFKYAVDNQWIGPWGRVALGMLAGAGTLVVAELLRPRTRAVWTQVITGVGLAFMLLAAYASHGFYGLVSATAALSACFVVSLLGGALAVRHDAESTLVVSLVAALAAPVLLSTGEDRPAALFAYLLLVTTLSHVAAVARGFRIAAHLGIVGAAVLFAGWHQRFFDVTLPDGDASPGGAYRSLGARVVPLGAVGLFALQWLALAVAARRRAPRLAPGVIAVVASVAGQAGVVVLLPDHLVLLAILVAVVAVPFTALLVREKRAELLAIPLVISCALLAGVLARSENHAPLTLLALVPWAAIHVVAAWRTPVRSSAWPGLRAALLGVVAVAFAVFGALLFVATHPTAFAVLVAALSFGMVLALTREAAASTLLMIAMFASSAFLRLIGVRPDAPPSVDGWLLAALALWAAVYVGAVAVRLFRRGDPVRGADVTTSSIAGLGFLALAWHQGIGAHRLLAAALFVAIGAVDLSLGAAVLRRPGAHDAASADRRFGSMWLAQALALFAAAFAFLFSGPVITIAWVALGAAVVGLAAREGDVRWLAGGAAVFVAAAFRLIAFDWPAVADQTARFWATSGAEGTLRPAFVLNGRGYATIAFALAGFLGARLSARRTSERRFATAAVAFLAASHLAVLALAVAEARGLALPAFAAPPRDLDASAFAAFANEYDDAVAQATNKVAVVTTLVLGGYAAVLLALGFALADRVHRYFGLGLFGLAIAKLALWDVWNLPRVLQMLVLAGMGALLLGASFLYARFGKRLVALLRGGPTAGAILVVVGALATAPRAQAAFDAADFAERREILGVPSAGLFRVVVDPVLYGRTKGLPLPPRIRVVGPQQQELPFVVRPVPVAAPIESRAVAVVDAVTLPRGGARATLDLGEHGLRHNRVSLQIGGDDFLRRTRVERSDDGRDWTLLAEGGVVSRVTTALAPHESLDVAYPPSDARYVRVTLLPAGQGSAVSISGARLALATAESETITDAASAVLLAQTPDPHGGGSLYDFDRGAPGAPAKALALDIDAPAFERRADVWGSDDRLHWGPVTSGWLYRSIVRGKTIESVSFALDGCPRRYLRVRIEDGDDRPLAIRGSRVTWIVEELVFRAAGAGAHGLLIGPASPASPRYDLAAVLDRGTDAAITTARFGELGRNPVHGQRPPAPAPWTERHATAITAAIVALLLALSGWTLRLLRPRRTAGPP